MSNQKNKKKVTIEEIQVVRKRYATEKCSYKQLAMEHGISVNQIKGILKGVVKWKPTNEERFWSKVNKGNPDECWEWLGTKDRYGYGRFHLNGKMEKAHRIAYQFTYGSIPEGEVVRHKVCRNRACCNPNHLKTGTQDDNQMDMMEDGTNWNKLSYTKALEAKFLREIEWNVKEIADYYGVNSTSISQQLNKLQDEETQLTYSYRAKRILDKEEATNNPPIKIVIDWAIE